jgi:hypothetical protein
MKKFTLGILVFVVLLAMTSAVSAAGWAVTAVPSVPGNIDPANPSYFNIQVTYSADQNILPLGTYTGWCSDSQTNIQSGKSYGFTAFSTLIDNPPSQAEAPGIKSVDWHRDNYILNNDANQQWQAIQAAFWHYDGGIPQTWSYNHGVYDALIAAATPHGGYVPECDPTKQSSFKYAIILYTPGVQTIFLEKTTECTPDVPEFPSMALPVGMLIGLVGLVFVIKTREQ